MSLRYCAYFQDIQSSIPSMVIAICDCDKFLSTAPTVIYKNNENQNERKDHIITYCKKIKKITTYLANQYFISTTFRTCFSSQFSNFNDEKIKVQVLQLWIATRGKSQIATRVVLQLWIATRGNCNVQSHDQEKSKLIGNIKANSGAHTLTHDKIMKSTFK